jgi:hypothetical protein
MQGNSFYKLNEGFPPFMAGCDIKKYQFVSTLLGIGGAQFHGVTHLPDVDEIDALNGLPVADIQTRYDAFC